jgi:hypothetical protein
MQFGKYVRNSLSTCSTMTLKPSLGSEKNIRDNKNTLFYIVVSYLSLMLRKLGAVYELGAVYVLTAN